MKGKVIHFCEQKILDLTDEDHQYFLDVNWRTRYFGLRHYPQTEISSSKVLWPVFFLALYQENDDFTEWVELMFQKHYNLCKLLELSIVLLADFL